MPRGYGAKLRGRVIDAVCEGISAREAGRRFNIGVATAVRWVAHWRATGEIDGPPRKGRRSRLDPHAEWLLAERRRDPEATLAALADRLKSEHDVKADPAMLSRFFARHGITFKKNALRE